MGGVYKLCDHDLNLSVMQIVKNKTQLFKEHLEYHKINVSRYL